MRSGKSCNSSSTSESSRKSKSTNQDISEDEKHAWKRKKPSLTRKSTRKLNQEVVTNPLVRNSSAAFGKRGRLPRNATRSNAQSSVITSPGESVHLDIMEKGSNADDPSGRKSFLSFVIDNYRKSTARVSVDVNSKTLQSKPGVIGGDQMGICDGENISNTNNKVNAIESKLTETNDKDIKNTNADNSTMISNAVEAQKSDQSVESKCSALAMTDSMTHQEGSDEDRSKSKSSEDAEIIDELDNADKQNVSELFAESIEHKTGESSIACDNDNEKQPFSSQQSLEDGKKMDTSDDPGLNEQDINRGNDELKKHFLKSTESVDTPVVSDTLGESVAINAEDKNKDGSMRSSTDVLSRSGVENDVATIEEKSTNELQEELQVSDGTGTTIQDAGMDDTTSNGDVMEVALQQVIAENIGSSEVSQTKNKQDINRYNLREKKKIEKPVFVTSLGDNNDDDTESDNSVQQRRRSDNDRLSLSSRPKITRIRRARATSMPSIFLDTDTPSFRNNEKVENPFFKYFRTLDQWFTSKEGKKNYPFRKCVCMYCEEHYKDGLQDEPPKAIIKKTRSCRTHLNNCIAYQLYLHKTGKKSVTETTEFGLRSHEIARLRARMEANATEIAALNGGVSHCNPDVTKSTEYCIQGNNPDIKQGTLDDEIDSRTSLRKRALSDTISKINGDDVDDKESADDIERRIQRRVEEEAEKVLSLTKRPKTLQHGFYDHFRFFDDSQVHIRMGVPTTNLRGFCIHCEEQYNSGVTDRKPDLVTKRARNCRSHLEHCKHYKVFLTTTGQSSVTKESLVGLDEKRRVKVVAEFKRIGKELPVVSSKRVDDINKEIVEREAASIGSRLRHQLLLSPSSDHSRKSQTLYKYNDDSADDEEESEAAQGLRTIFEQIVPLAEVDPDICTMAMEQMNDTLTNLRNIIKNKKRKFDEALVKVNGATSGSRRRSSSTGAGSTSKKEIK
jgi:hypothetical protein